MATYINGVTDYIPQIQPFRPDFNFYTQAMRFKQSKHDAARRQLSDLYGSLLNAPMTREDNIAARDKFFKTIKEDINKLSGMDLSLEANVQQGQMLFNQLTDNTNIVKDMVWTKHFQNQMAKGKALKDCADPEKCGGSWWEGGDSYMAYKMQEFKNASAEDAMKMGMVDYVSQQDVMGKAMKLAKDAGLSITMDQLQGGYITTTKNGPLLQGPLSNLFTGTLAKDGKILEYYKAKAYVDRKNFGMANADKYGSVEAAESFYIQQNADMLEKLYNTQTQTTKDDAATNKKIKEEVLNDVNKNGANPKSTVWSELEQMDLEEKGYESSSKVYENAGNETALAKRNLSGRALDGAMAAYYLGNDINKAAQTLAMKDYEFKMEADKYSLEAVQQRNRLLLEDVKQKNRLDMEKFKFDNERYLKQMELMGPAALNTPSETIVNGSTTGSLTWNEDGYMGYDKLEAGANQFSEDYQKMQNDLSAPEKGILSMAYKATESAASLGNTQAKSDYVAMTMDYLAAQGAADPQSGLDIKSVGVDEESQDPSREMVSARRQEFNNTLAKIQSAKSLDEKFAIAKKAGVDINSLSGFDADQMYMNTVEKFSADNAQGENIRRPYMRQVNQMAIANKENIKAKREYLAKMDSAYANLALGVINKVKAGKGGYSQEMIDAMEAYIDTETGHAKSYEEFEKAYMAKGYTREQAQAIYRQDEEYDYSTSGAGSYAKSIGRNIYEAAEGAAIPAAAGWLSGTAAAAVSAAGGTAAATGPFGWGAAAVAFLAANGLYNLWEATLGDGDYGLIGFDFKGPGYYEGNRGGYGATPETGGVGKGNPGLLDAWKRAFSAQADPPGDYGWMNIHGLGQRSTKAINYQIVDPKYTGAASTIGTLGMMKDVLRSTNAKVTMGGFGQEIPEEVDAEALKILGIAMTDMSTNTKGASRLTPNVTYSHIAGGNDDWVAMNIKFNDAFSNRFKGNEDNPGPTRGLQNQLRDEGITMYVPKAEANNIFTTNAERTSLDILMDYNNEVTIDASPRYTKGLRVTRGPNGYYTEGLAAQGINPDGSFDWVAFQKDYGNNVDLTSAFTDANKLAVDIDKVMQLQEKQWNLANGIKETR